MAMDPWASTNQGLANLTNTLGTLAQLKRQDQQYADEATDRAARRTLADLQLQGAQRKNTDELALRDALSNAKGGYLYPEPTGMGPVQPGQESALSGLGPVQQPASQMDRLKVTAGLASQGNTAAQGQLPTMIDLDAKLAEMEMQTMAGGGDRAGFLKKKADFEQGKEMIKTLSPLVSKGGEAGRGLAQKLLDGYKSFQPDNPIVQNMTLDDFSTKDDNLVVAIKDPTTGDVIGYNVLDPETSKSTFHFKPKEAPSKPFDRKYNDGDTEVTELYDASGKLTGTKKAPRYKPAAPATDKTDPIVAREAVKDLPKLRREARTAEATKPRITQMVQLLDGGNAGGLKGNALASVSGIFDIPATSEAELFKKLAAAGAGQLRASVIGPGAVSNYEQNLLQSVSGGGSGARTAIRQLLKYYEQEADRTISNYNDAVDSAATVAPKVTKGFGKIGASKGGGGTKKPLSAY
ncbi:MAG: hypothetical protein A2Y38_15650 [Spirochaetes bacterium GWB1_59_5]|nr:MAG: hypothetical protein A2Y38_15650 [Spirochaetes bacterium GWB1_59_5]